MFRGRVIEVVRHGRVGLLHNRTFSADGRGFLTGLTGSTESRITRSDPIEPGPVQFSRPASSPRLAPCFILYLLSSCPIVRTPCVSTVPTAVIDQRARGRSRGFSTGLTGSTGSRITRSDPIEPGPVQSSQPASSPRLLPGFILYLLSSCPIVRTPCVSTVPTTVGQRARGRRRRFLTG